MPDWDELILEALQQMSGDIVAIPGARLRERVAALAAQQGLNLEEHLATKGIRFANLLEGVARVVVQKRPGTDMLVGLEPTSARRDSARNQLLDQGLALRHDVYEAFTRVSPTQFFYVRDSDQFTLQPPDASSAVPVPRVQWSDLLEIRQEFVSQRTEPAIKEDLERSLTAPNPLGAFQAAVLKHNLWAQWWQHFVLAIYRRVETWAETNGLPVSLTWRVASATSDFNRRTPQSILSDLARHMTEDEIRSLSIPFRAIEAFVRSLRS